MALAPETPLCVAGTLGRCTLAAQLTLHADLRLGCEQVLWAGSLGSASPHLPAVPSLDGDGGSVHLVDKPAGG